MDALKASYASSSDDEDNTETTSTKKPRIEGEDGSKDAHPLLPSPTTFLDFSSNLFVKNVDYGNRIRSFPHVEGNYAVHVYIPVNLSSMDKELITPLMKKAGLFVPELHTIDTDMPLCSGNMENKDGAHVDVPTLAEEYHISLSRTVAIRVHQIDSLVGMLRNKLHSQKRFWIEFAKWEVFINDDQTRSFLALEVTTRGLSEISKQICIVDECFRRHNLPEFYKNPRPHISVAWGLGNITSTLKEVAEELNKLKRNTGSTKKSILTCPFSRIECKIGQKMYSICKLTK